MDRNLTLALVLLALACCALAQRNRNKPPKKEKIPEVEQRCMECICQASSDCDETLKCHNSGDGGYFCGPYVISWAYWHDGGRPGDRGKAHDFETCLTNKTCAEEAVRGYMRRYGQDCDKDQDIDCNDFARIHKLGFGSCGGDAILNTDYWEKFDICYNGYHSSYDDNGANYNNDGFPNFPAQPLPAEQPAEYDYGDGVIQARNGHAN